MQSFYEYMAQQQNAGLPDPITMLSRMGISPSGPHDVEIQRMVKRQEKRAVAQPSPKAGTKVAPTSPQRGQNRPGSVAR
jgi:hypothetical protein